LAGANDAVDNVINDIKAKFTAMGRTLPAPMEDFARTLLTKAEEAIRESRSGKPLGTA